MRPRILKEIPNLHRLEFTQTTIDTIGLFECFSMDNAVFFSINCRDVATNKEVDSVFGKIKLIDEFCDTAFSFSHVEFLSKRTVEEPEFFDFKSSRNRSLKTFPIKTVENTVKFFFELQPLIQGKLAGEAAVLSYSFDVTSLLITSQCNTLAASTHYLKSQCGIANASYFSEITALEQKTYRSQLARFILMDKPKREENHDILYNSLFRRKVS